MHEKINLFIDTNIFLTFYNLSNDDLDELKKLAILIDAEKINLLLPEQTKNEFIRSRDNSILSAINSLKEQKINSRFPQISKGYKEFILLKEAFKNFEKQKNKIIDKIKEDAKDRNLNADKIIQLIFDLANPIKTTDQLIYLAKTRFDLGNPPGKGNSYGDALNWECLLSEVNSELHLISGDNDFTSNLDRREFNSFLKNEWKSKKNYNIYFYKTISDFFKDKFPEIKLSSVLEKEVLIEGLANATSFASAKSKLSRLLKIREFTTQELNDIVEISISNNQLYWINNDYGVKDVLCKIIEGHEDKIDSSLMKEFDFLYRGKNVDDNLPF